MKRAILRSVAGASLLVFGLTMGMAQERHRDRDDSWYHDRDAFYRTDTWHAHLFQRVREDLDRVQATTFEGSRDDFRIATTKQELNELQNKLAAGQYDQREVDDVIAGVQRVVESNKLTARDRDMLTDDLNRLRDYRAHHDNWGR
jgi:hypothetical protein